LKTTIETIRAVRATSSKNEKLAILNAQKDNEDLRGFLRMAYEPRINFYVKNVEPEMSSMFHQTTLVERFTDDTMAEVYDTIAKRELTGNAARRWLADLWCRMDRDGKELLELLIQRDVKAGISEGTINKVWSGLVTDPPYMRCCLPKDADLNNWPWAQGVISQIKADGMFANVSVHRGTSAVTIESRAGSPFPLDAFQDLVYEVQELVPEGHQLHGELLMMAPDGTILPREIGNGMFNRLLKEGELDDGHRPTFQVWDIIPLEEAKAKNKYNVAYKKRFAYLLDLFKDCDTEFLHVIEYELVYSLNEAYAHAGKAMARKLEGTVIKHPEAIWEDTTSRFQVKLKLEFEVDLRIKRLKPADPKSKNAATFGSMECESECGLLEVGVTGLKDDKRKYIFDNFDTMYRDSITTVRANGIMEPTEPGGKCSLFLPRFIEERWDKKIADSLQRIREIQQAAVDAVQISK
jgi:DNA ligase-1